MNNKDTRWGLGGLGIKDAFIKDKQDLEHKVSIINYL